MDTKSARKNFYKNKVYLSEKYDAKYSTERFQQDLQWLLDEYIPKATLKQMTKFMDKKYLKIVKNFPEVQKALKKVIRDKLDKIPQELRESQIKKLLHSIQQQYPKREFIKEGIVYKLLEKGKKNWDGISTIFHFEEIQINVLNNG